MKRWGVHVCMLDKDCRAAGAPWRASLQTPWVILSLALRPQDRFAQTDKTIWEKEHRVVLRRSTWWDVRKASL